MCEVYNFEYVTYAYTWFVKACMQGASQKIKTDEVFSKLGN